MIPISTDAPIYYLPIVTVTAILLNVVCFLAFCLNSEPEQISLITPDGRVIASEEQITKELDNFKTEEEATNFLNSLTVHSTSWQRRLSVEFGTVKPWQWVTNNFMHANWGHLIGNMIFLWAFGLIVEGKVGPLLFAAIYLGIGTTYGGILQLSSLATGGEGIALGASAAIFGLLALCVAWAPANEFTILFRFGTFDISILLYGALFLTKELGFWALHGFQMSSELLHIIGFAVAMPIGLWMVRSGKVDCEGWDLFSYLSGNTGKHSTVGTEQAQVRQRTAIKKQKAKSTQLLAREAAERADSGRRMHDQVQQAIDQGQIELAIKLQSRLTAADPTTNWKQKDLYRVVQALLKAKDFTKASSLMETHIELFEQSRFSMQIALMKIWLSQRHPNKTLHYLQGLNQAFMSPNEVQQIEHLSAAAKKMQKGSGL